LLQTGFFSSAPIFLDIATIYYFLLPFLLFASIRYAIKGEYKKHIKSQLVIFVITMIVIVFFEVGIRMNGGFVDLVKQSGLPFKPMMYFLVVHIIIAFTSVCMWWYLIVTSFVSHKRGELISYHAKLGHLTFAGIAFTCIAGVLIYYLLFIYN